MTCRTETEVSATSPLLTDMGLRMPACRRRRASLGRADAMRKRYGRSDVNGAEFDETHATTLDQIANIVREVLADDAIELDSTVGLERLRAGTPSPMSAPCLVWRSRWASA